MCDPITLGVIAVIGSVAGSVSANKQAKAQAKALKKANTAQTEQIAARAGQEMNQLTRAARRERAAARAAASESGVNLDSGSFLAQLQASQVNQAQDGGVVLYNERNAQKARQADYEGRLSQISIKTPIGIGLDAAVSGVATYAGAGGKTYFGKNPGKG